MPNPSIGCQVVVDGRLHTGTYVVLPGKRILVTIDGKAALQAVEAPLDGPPPEMAIKLLEHLVREANKLARRSAR